MKNSILFLVIVCNLLLLHVNAMSYNLQGEKSPVIGTGSDNHLQTKLLYFTANQKDKEVVINWKTSTEKDNAFFTIEKSSDGVNFDILTTENGAGTNLSEHEYFSFDFLPTRGFSYYRLSQTNFDGSKNIFEIQKVEYKIELSIFPNMDENQINIYGIPKNTHAVISLLDENSKEIMNVTHKDIGAVTIELSDVSEEVYFIKIKDDYTEWIEKVVR